MWGVIAGAASRAQNLASNVKSVLLEEQDSPQQEFDDTGTSVEYGRHSHGPFDRSQSLGRGDFDNIGELPPVSSNAAETAVTPSMIYASSPPFSTATSSLPALSHPRITAAPASAFTAVARNKQLGDGTSYSDPHRADTTFGEFGSSTAAADGNQAAAPSASTAASPGVGSIGMGRMLGTSATSTMSFFSSATTVLQKVATHVVGAEEAADGSKQKPQVELLKQQLIAVTVENDSLMAEVSRLKRSLEDAEESVELLQAQAQTAGLLRQELTTEQKSHETSRREVEKLTDKMRRMEQQLESDAADVAQHDSFWKAELQQQREVAAQAQSRIAELETLVEQLKAKLQQEAAADKVEADIPDVATGKAAEAAAARVVALEAQLAASQAITKETERRIASLESELAEVRHVAGQRHLEEQQDAAAKADSELQALRDQLADGAGAVESALSAAAAAAEARAEAAEAWAVKVETRMLDARAQLLDLQVQVEKLRGEAQAAEVRAAEAEATAAGSAAVKSELQRKLTEVQKELQGALEHGTNATSQLRNQLIELERQLDEQREAHHVAIVAAEARVAEAEAAATAARAAAVATAGRSADDDGDGPLASMREQLEMMKELFEEEQRFGLQHRQKLEDERTAHTATRTRLAEVEEEQRQLQTRLAEAQVRCVEADARVTDAVAAVTSANSEAAARAEVAEKVAEVENRLAKAAAEAEEAGARAAEMERRLRGAVEEAEAARQEVKGAAEAWAKRERELQEAHERLTLGEVSLASELAEARRRCTAAEARVEEVMVQVAALKDSLAAEQAAAAVANARSTAAASELQMQVLKARRHQEVAEGEVDKLRDEVQLLGDKAMSLAAQLADERQRGREEAEERVWQLTQQLEGLEAEARTLQTKLDAADARCLKTAEEAAEALIAERAATAAAAQQASQDLDALLEKAQRLGNELAESSRSQQELGRRAEVAEAAITRLQEALGASETARQQLTAELQQQRAASTAAAGSSNELVSELTAASQRMAALQTQVAQLQHALDDQANRSQTVLQDRDMFWKRELSERTVAVTDLERRLKQAQEQSARDADALQVLRSEAERLRMHSSTTAANVAATEAGLRRELEALQAALERAQDSTRYDDHDTHVEKELAAARGDVVRLQSEARRFQVQLESAHVAAASAASEASRFQLETRSLAAQLAAVAAERDAATAELRQLSHVYQQHLAQQRQEMQQVVASASASATPRQGSRQESAMSTCLSAAVDAATNANVSGTGSVGGHDTASTEGGALAAAILEVEVSELRSALEATEAERERLKNQLLRLKAQMIREQEEEEDKVGWRVEAEVKASEERYAGQVAELREALETARAAALRQQAEITALSKDLELKDTEIQYLQAALGELTYESEAAEKLRLEVRATANKVMRLQQELVAAQAAVAAAQAEREAAKRSMEQTRASLTAAAASEARTADECAMLRRALDQAVAQAAAMSSETNGMVDRRIMGKLLLTYFQRNHSKEVLQLMARMLNMSDEDRAALGLLGSRRGLLSRVAGAPLAIVSGAGRMLARAGSQGAGLHLGGLAGGGGGGAMLRGNGDSLADQWVQFLLSQDEAAQRQQAALEQQQQEHVTQGQGLYLQDQQQQQQQKSLSILMGHAPAGINHSSPSPLPHSQQPYDGKLPQSQDSDNSTVATRQMPSWQAPPPPPSHNFTVAPASASSTVAYRSPVQPVAAAAAAAAAAPVQSYSTGGSPPMQGATSSGSGLSPPSSWRPTTSQYVPAEAQQHVQMHGQGYGQTTVTSQYRTQNQQPLEAIAAVPSQHPQQCIASGTPALSVVGAPTSYPTSLQCTAAPPLPISSFPSSLPKAKPLPHAGDW